MSPSLCLLWTFFSRDELWNWILNAEGLPSFVVWTRSQLAGISLNIESFGPGYWLRKIQCWAPSVRF